MTGDRAARFIAGSAAILACSAPPAGVAPRLQAAVAAEIDSQVTVKSEADIEQRREQMIRFFWGAAGRPTSTPARVNKNITGISQCLDLDCDRDAVSRLCTTYHCSEQGAKDVQAATSPKRFGPLRNLGRVDELVFKMGSGERSVAQHLIAAKSNGRLVVLHQGHGCVMGVEDGMLPTLDALLARGYSVLVTYMPHYQPDLCDVELHDEFFLKTAVSAGHVSKFFLEPVVVGLNYLRTMSAADDFPKYISYDMVGLSGGGWTTVMYAALDPTIERSVAVAGTLPFTMGKCKGGRPYAAEVCAAETRYTGQDGYNGYMGDAEQAHPAIYAATGGYLDLYTMAGQGAGRRHVQVSIRYELEPNGPGPLTKAQVEANIRAYEKQVQTAIAATGAGRFDSIIDTVAQHHMIGDWTLANVVMPTLDRPSGPDGAAPDGALGDAAARAADGASEAGAPGDVSAGAGAEGAPVVGGGHGCMMARAPGAPPPLVLGLFLGLLAGWVVPLVVRRAPPRDSTGWRDRWARRRRRMS